MSDLMGETIIGNADNHIESLLVVQLYLIYGNECRHLCTGCKSRAC